MNLDLKDITIGREYILIRETDEVTGNSSDYVEDKPYLQIRLNMSEEERKGFNKICENVK